MIILYVPIIQKAIADAIKESSNHLMMKRLSGPKGSDTKRTSSTAKNDATRDITISRTKTIAGLRKCPARYFLNLSEIAKIQ